MAEPAVEDSEFSSFTVGSFSERAGFRLDELHVQNFGSYDGAPSVLQFNRGSAIFTGRNGVGKTTAIDAFRMLVAQEPNFNDATVPEARKRDRDIRTYYLGVLGKVQQDGRNEYVVLRQYEDRKFMAIVGNFSDGRGHTVSAARLVQYDAQGQGNSQRYILARHPLNIATDFPQFETARTIRNALADKGVTVYETFASYRAALSARFGIDDAKQAWALFERAIGTKTVDNLTEFMRELILPMSVLAETADQLVRSTAALDDAYQAVKQDEQKLTRLQRIIREIDEVEQSFAATERLKRLQSYRKQAETVVLARAVRRDVARRHTELVATRRISEAASAQLNDLTRRVSDLERQERDLGGQRVIEWRQEIENRTTQMATVTTDLEKLSKALAEFGLSTDVSFEQSHHTQDQWERIKGELNKAADRTPARTGEMDVALARLSSELATLETELKNATTDLNAAERSRSNLPRQHVEIREKLAEALGVVVDSLPFFGELVRVAPHAAAQGWEGAINRLLANQARRLLVDEALYPRAAAWIDRSHLGLRLEYDRVDPIALGSAKLGDDRVAGKLEVRPGNRFAGHVRRVLDTRYDHECFTAADDNFRRCRRGLTKAGQSRDGDRHVKDDRRHIDDRSSFVLGWDSTERIAHLSREIKRIEAMQRSRAEQGKTLRAGRDNFIVKATQMRQLADSMGDFERVDLCRIESEIEEREAWIEEATAKDPSYVAISKALAKARAEVPAAKKTADERSGVFVVQNHELNYQTERLRKLDAEVGKRRTPYSEWKGYCLIARQAGVTASIFEEDPAPNATRGVGVWETIRSGIETGLDKESTKREKLLPSLTRLGSDYFKEFSTETALLSVAGLTDEDGAGTRADWRQRRTDIEGRELVRHRERLQQAMTDAIDNGIVNIKTQLEKERLEIRDTVIGINETLRAVTYDPVHGTRMRFKANDAVSQRIATFTKDLRQVTDDWIGNSDGNIEERYTKTKRFIDQVKDVPENNAWRREVLDSRRWFTFIAQEYKLHADGTETIINDYDGATGSSGGQKERLAMTVMAAGLAWRFGMVNPAAAHKSFRVLMLDEAFKNSHDDTIRALLQLFSAFGFQMIFAMPSKNLAVVARHIERAFAVDTKDRRTVVTVHGLKNLVQHNQSMAAASALMMAKEAGINVEQLDLAKIDERLAGLTTDALERVAASGLSNELLNDRGG
nr:SbcC/MukB-like Walker B domain-containing protein [Bradyrhizobium uaiense]